MLDGVDYAARELAVRLARQARRRAYVRRLLLRCLVGGVVTGLSLVAALVLAQQARPRLAGATHPRPTGVAHVRTGAGATLTLDPVRAGHTGPTTLRVTLADRTGAPLPGITIWLTISGAAPFYAAATTNASGLAYFQYQGAVGPYTVHITATAGGATLAQSTVQVDGSPPAVRTSAVLARFSTSDGRCTFDTPATTHPVLAASFPGINFYGRPLADHPSDPTRSPVAVAGNGYTVGREPLNHFNAALTGTLLVARAGDVAFTILVDDAFNLGLGGGASRVGGTMSNPPAGGRTAVERLPVVGAFNQGHLEATTAVTVRFPRPGSYPYEFDWAECAGGGEGLRVSTGGQFLPSTADSSAGGAP